MVSIDSSLLTQAAYLTIIGMFTSFSLLLLLITSILITRVVSNRIHPPYIQPTNAQREELQSKAKAAAIAVAYVSLSQGDLDTDAKS